ncbi:MAG: sulfatase-like hydrolase/transferase [bacterium]|nr:sulfatase-like hydrolase/transferase [bacterium]
MWVTLLLSFCLIPAASALAAKDKIIHDAEYYVLEAQNGEKWAADDKKIDKKLAEIRKKNGGKPPNIIYILLDDVGFGELGMPDLNVIRGYKTPNLDALARQGLSLQRMYTEPSCTPTRVALLTGRHPVRTGLVEAKTTLAGEGLAAEEVTIAEVLRDAGYATSHVGKWHMGDIEQAFANNQGFMHAEFPIHQQAQLALMNPEAVQSDITRGIEPGGQAEAFLLDQYFVTDSSRMLTGVELRDGKLYEVDLKPGERWTQKKYREMNERYQESALEQLRGLAKHDKPFFLNYWPMLPVTFTRTDIEEFMTPNGGTFAEGIVEIDAWVGQILDEVDRLGIADNTIVMAMGDNGTMIEYMGLTGAADRIYRGGKGQHLEGGVRVNAFVRWPGVIEPGSSAEDIMHVSDLFTTFARLGNATDNIPADRVIDGVDQTGVLLLGETHGRRDYVYVYEGVDLRSVVKNKYKMHLPAPGEHPILGAGFFDLYRDPREEQKSQSIKLATWAAGQFASMIQRHMGLRQKYPDRPPTHGAPYGGIENLRPETEELIEVFLAGQPAK